MSGLVGRRPFGFRLTLAGGPMISVSLTRRSLVEVLLPEGEKLRDPVLRRIDSELEDKGLSTSSWRPWRGAARSARVEVRSTPSEPRDATARGRISVLKRRYGLRWRRYRDLAGMRHWVVPV